MVKTLGEIEKIRRASRVCKRIVNRLADVVVAGGTTGSIEEAALAHMKQEGVEPAFRGYRGYPAAICVSVNEEVVHGIPRATRVLRQGDLVSVDVGVLLDGFYSDCAATYPVPPVSRRRMELLESTRRCLAEAIGMAVVGKRIGDVAAAIERTARADGFSVIRKFAGHGVGSALHEPPEVPNYGRPGTGEVLKENMVLAIEPMVSEGDGDVRVLSDGWTVVTTGGGCSAHFEDVVLVGPQGAVVLTECS